MPKNGDKLMLLILIHPGGGKLASNFEMTSLRTQEQENSLFKRGLHLLPLYFQILAECGSGGPSDRSVANISF